VELAVRLADVPGSPLLWKRTPGRDDEYELQGPSNIEDWISVQKLCELLEAKPPTQRNDHRLLLLDEGMQAWLTRLHELHTGHWSGGLFQPANVYFAQGADNKVIVIEPDRGFYWDPACPCIPSWLRPPEDTASFWDEAPEQRQRVPDGATPASDLRSVCRIIDRVVPKRARKASSLHKTIREGIQGRYTSAADLATALRKTPLSSVFFPRRWMRWRHWLLVLGLFLALLAVGWTGLTSRLQSVGHVPEMETLADSVDRTDDTDDLPTGSALASDLKELSHASPKDQPTILVRLYNRRSEHPKSRQKETLVCDALRATYLRDWRQRFDFTTKKGKTEIDLARLEAQQLRSELQLLSTSPSQNPQLIEEETRCLKHVEVLLVGLAP
jgi:hypothetical protein